jgi:hypothetical protein
VVWCGEVGPGGSDRGSLRGLQRGLQRGLENGLGTGFVKVASSLSPQSLSLPVLADEDEPPAQVLVVELVDRALGLLQTRQRERRERDRQTERDERERRESVREKA